ncbi:hypothetical protein QBC47DRAFT_223121 [Echria macrotheca]|uniref:Uncharacterized protein n=1 Tax=Echria macrotheca TaxID=438768 RepID=A0AAJ0BCP8_9PEZI|nr:hypothetical protein QBC47DRAFT_223121 [Echria macrotheca]
MRETRPIGPAGDGSPPVHRSFLLGDSGYYPPLLTQGRPAAPRKASRSGFPSAQSWCPSRMACLATIPARLSQQPRCGQRRTQIMATVGFRAHDVPAQHPAMRLARPYPEALATLLQHMLPTYFITRHLQLVATPACHARAAASGISQACKALSLNLLGGQTHGEIQCRLWSPVPTSQAVDDPGDERIGRTHGTATWSFALALGDLGSCAST